MILRTLKNDAADSGSKDDNGIKRERARGSKDLTLGGIRGLPRVLHLQSTTNKQRGWCAWKDQKNAMNEKENREIWGESEANQPLREIDRSCDSRETLNDNCFYIGGGNPSFWVSVKYTNSCCSILILHISPCKHCFFFIWPLF